MATLAELLTQAAAALNITGVPATVQPGQVVTASLAPQLTAVQFTEVIPTAVSLDLIAKDVVFANNDIADTGFAADPALTKIKPLFNLTSVPPSVDTSGVGGLIGKIEGTLPLPVPVAAIPKITVRWTVLNGDDQEVSDYDSPGGRNRPTFNVIFFPVFTTFDGTLPPRVARKIQAKVTLTAGATTGTAVVAVFVGVPAIPFPKVLVLSLHQYHTGPALVMVPGNSAITTINQVKSLLQPVRNAISTLSTIASLAEMILGIDAATSALENANIAFTRADAVRNLNDTDLVTRAWYENNTEAEDELSSFVYLSPPPDRDTSNAVEMFIARRFSAGEGKFTVTTGDAFVAACASLHTATPEVTPSGANLTVNNPPRAFVPQFATFGDLLSSIRFL